MFNTTLGLNCSYLGKLYLNNNKMNIFSKLIDSLFTKWWNDVCTVCMCCGHLGYHQKFFIYFHRAKSCQAGNDST